MKRVLIALLAVLLCGAAIFWRTPNSSQSTDAALPKAEVIPYADISGNYLFVQNLDETERMADSLCGYLNDDGVQIQTTVPEDAVFYAESVWDPAWAAALPGGPGYCVEAWDIYKDGTFQKTAYQVCRT